MHGLIGAGIDHFIDLTGEEDWLEPYDNLAQEEGRRLGKTMRRESYPMSGVDVPRRHGDMNAILDAIDAALDARSSVYVHCWAGVGRTGTVVGCWLVRHGFTGDEALEQIAEWWKGVEKADRIPNSPETHVQREYVRRWTETSQERCHG